MKTSRHQNQEALICLGLALVTLALYWPVGSHPFIHYDDHEYITTNRAIQSGLTWESVKWAFTAFYAANWHPLTWLSHALDIQLFGLNAGAHHLVNLALHVGAALALFMALRRLTGSLWRSAVVAAFFAWHPLQVESVAWASERKNTLSTLFWWLTVWAYAAYAARAIVPLNPSRFSKGAPASWTAAVLRRFLSPWRLRKRQGTGALQNLADHARFRGMELRGSGAPALYALALALFALGLMAKQMLVTLPCVLLLLDYWPLGRWRAAPDDTAASDKLEQPGWRRWLADWLPPGPVARRLLLEKIPFFALSAAASAATFFAQKPQAVVPVESIPIALRVENGLVSYVRYLAKMFWPADLAVFYPFPPAVPAWQVIAATLFLLCVTVAVVACRRRRACLLTGWLWYLGTLVPVIGLVQVGSQGMADRYAYVPIAGVLIPLVWSLADWASSSRRRRAGVAIGLSLAAASCLTLTRQQLTYWESGSKLFAHTVAVTENNYYAYDNLATAFALEGRYTNAMRHYREALRINPVHAPAHNDLGVALMRFGKTDEALAHYRAALGIKPDYAMAHYNLAGALTAAGKLEEAIAHYRNALRLLPDHADARYNLGATLEQQGKPQEAVVVYSDLIKRSPHYAPAHHRLGVLLARQRRIDEAVASLHQALALDPQLAEAHNDLGLVLSQQGQADAARSQFSAALRINPRLAQAHLNLAASQLMAGQLQPAREHFAEAARLRPGLARAHRGLGEVLMTEGRWREAIEPLTQARSRDPNDPVTCLNLASAWVHEGERAKAIRHLREAVQLAPNWPPPLIRLAWLLATAPESNLRDGPQAVQLAERACELTNRQMAAAVDTLAAAYAEAGQFEKAAATARTALELAQAANQQQLAGQIQNRLQLYQAGKPCREQP